MHFRKNGDRNVVGGWGKKFLQVMTVWKAFSTR